LNHAGDVRWITVGLHGPVFCRKHTVVPGLPEEPEIVQAHVLFLP
jgi:hypothetical protein